MEGTIKNTKDLNKLYLTYYILSFVVLSFNVFIFKTQELNFDTYRTGFHQFNNGIGWLYYLVNLFGIATIFVKQLSSIENISAKVISAANIVISSIVLLQLVPSAIGKYGLIDYFGIGKLGIGFWIIFILHISAFTLFWFKTIKSYIDQKNQKVEVIIED